MLIKRNLFQELNVVDYKTNKLTKWKENQSIKYIHKEHLYIYFLSTSQMEKSKHLEACLW